MKWRKNGRCTGKGKIRQDVGRADENGYEKCEGKACVGALDREKMNRQTQEIHSLGEKH